MTVFHLDGTGSNMLVVSGERFFLMRRPGRATVELLPDACPHRGGPLRLGRLAADDAVLVCPWHGAKLPIEMLKKSSPAWVSRGHHVTVVVPGAAPGDCRMISRRVEAGTSCAGNEPACKSHASSPEIKKG